MSCVVYTRGMRPVWCTRGVYVLCGVREGYVSCVVYTRDKYRCICTCVKVGLSNFSHLAVVHSLYRMCGM